ncbi:MAG: hypothetical protein Q4F07_06730 [Bacteroidales bacterium]|nr:hypothetical protein [Bacteroidales bacterium]
MAKHLLLLIFAISAYSVSYAQQSSENFAHISLPAEIKYLTWNNSGPYVGNHAGIWKIDTKTWTPDSAVALKSNNPFKTIQGIAGRENDLYFYINGEGVYRMQSKGMKPLLVRPRSEDFVKNLEEAYSSMGTDPTGQYLLLYGQNENAVVFDIFRDMSPVAVFNDYVMDAYWIGNNLWAGCLDKVVLNSRTGKSINNEDFIGLEDQSGMTKFYVGEITKIPENGEKRIQVNGGGDIVRLIYNKKNGDLLLCLSSWADNKSSVYRMTPDAALPVATFNGAYGDFAAYGDKIVARTGRGFVEISYGDKLTDVEPKLIITDILRPKLWKGDKPSPYEIIGSSILDFDKDGNLWIASGRDLFVKFNK